MAQSTSVTTLQRTILLADVVSSTALYEELGNIAAKQRVGGCVGMLAATAKRFEGLVVKSLGDGILCSYENANDAVMSALAMCKKAADFGLEVKVGIHCGEVLEDGGDVFGDAVNTAARIVDLARPQEVLISHDLRVTLPTFFQYLVRSVPPVALKGKRVAIELFSIVQDGLEGTDLSQTLSCESLLAATSRETAILHLYYDQDVVSVGVDSNVTIGRANENALTVKSRHVSRKHARIYHRQGKFVLVDESTNGTYLTPDGHPQLHIVREQAMLHGSGKINLGVDPEVSHFTPIRYHMA